MNCQEIIQTATALQILQGPPDKRLAALFKCIYALFQGSFLNWILNKYATSPYKDKLREDAKDAFQNGLMVFYRKAQEKGFSISGGLKTTIYSFGLLQLLAFFKKEKRVYHQSDYSPALDLFFEDGFLEAERHQWLNEKETALMEALAQLPKKQREILVMKFFGKLRSKQIAEKLAVTVGNVDNDSAKAYKELRRILQLKRSFKNKINGTDRAVI